MGLFGMNPMKEMGGWEASMTEEEIAKMEKQGYDVTDLRKTRQAMAEQQEAEVDNFKERRKATAVATDLHKLTAYRTTPRSSESDFFREVAGKPPLFGKDKWRDKYCTAPLIYGAVVQANSDLWLPGQGDYLPAVFVFALDSAHMYDVEWLQATAEKIKEMKVADTTPADCKEFMDILRDDQSSFCFPLSATLAGNAEAWCVTYKFTKQTILPGNRLPEDGIVPFLLEEKPKKQIPVQLAVIPGSFYRA